jgi:RNA polymerase sigma-70 factor, ECF subfamily
LKNRYQWSRHLIRSSTGNRLVWRTVRPQSCSQMAFVEWSRAPLAAAPTGTAATAALRATDANADLPDDPIVVSLVEQAIGSRDRAAFAELYERFVERIYRYVYYRTGSQLDAEDLSEQVFLKAWTSIHQFRWQGKPFQAWLYTLAHNVVVDHFRSARRTTSLDDSKETTHLASESTSHSMDSWLDADMLARAIRHLPRDQQHVIGLRFLEGRDTAEVAQLMNTREKTVRALQFRALHRLRGILDRQHQSDGW